MIPYKIKFILNDKEEDALHFESNEKPFKGELQTIEDADGKLWEAKIIEVTKVIIRTKKTEATIEFRCKVEKHEAATNVIGFGKRT